MPEILFQLPDHPGANLQTRIREMLVAAILDGHLPAGSPVPSGRKLAQQLKVARNTVVLAYEHLVDEGYLVARERSGFYVNDDILKGRAVGPAAAVHKQENSPHWHRRLKGGLREQRQITKPADWQNYDFPFLYGQYDPALFPIADWRECCRDAASVRAIHAWASDRADQDDPELLEQLHTRVLPRRGVWANPDEILVTLGAQHALYLAAELLVSRDTVVGMEEPGYTDARHVFQVHSNRVKPLPLDQGGLIVDEQLNDCECVYVTPSHQLPTTVTMSAERRTALLRAAEEKDFVLLEDDYEAELNFAETPHAALKSADHSGRVIYIGSLSKTLAPGLRMGYLVGPKAFIDEARILRRLMLRHPPANNQFIVSQFLKRGFHDALVRRLHHSLEERWRVTRDALQEQLPGALENTAFGGSAFWLRLPDHIDPDVLEHDARELGLLVETGNVFFACPQHAPPYIRLGFSSIATSKINEGIKTLAQLIRRY